MKLTELQDLMSRITTTVANINAISGVKQTELRDTSPAYISDNDVAYAAQVGIAFHYLTRLKNDVEPLVDKGVIEADDAIGDLNISYNCISDTEDRLKEAGYIIKDIVV